MSHHPACWWRYWIIPAPVLTLGWLCASAKWTSSYWLLHNELGRLAVQLIFKQHNSPFVQPTVPLFPAKKSLEASVKSIAQTQGALTHSPLRHTFVFSFWWKASNVVKFYPGKTSGNQFHSFLSWKLIPRGYVSWPGIEVKPAFHIHFTYTSPYFTLPYFLLAVLWVEATFAFFQSLGTLSNTTSH